MKHVFINPQIDQRKTVLRSDETPGGIFNSAGDEEEGLEKEIWASVFTAVQTQKEFSCRLVSQGTFSFQVTVISGN